jgi:hypothetical protein
MFIKVSKRLREEETIQFKGLATIMLLTTAAVLLPTMDLVVGCFRGLGKADCKLQLPQSEPEFYC